MKREYYYRYDGDYGKVSKSLIDPLDISAELYVAGKGFISFNYVTLEYKAIPISKQEFQQGITTLITKNRTKR